MVNGDDFMPKECFFTKGVGRHAQKLMSFELALRDAGIEKQNLVRVSSIYPTSCKIIPLKEGLPSSSRARSPSSCWPKPPPMSPTA